jgi:hypothetical protein
VSRTATQNGSVTCSSRALADCTTTPGSTPNSRSPPLAQPCGLCPFLRGNLAAWSASNACGKIHPGGGCVECRFVLRGCWPSCGVRWPAGSGRRSSSCVRWIGEGECPAGSGVRSCCPRAGGIAGSLRRWAPSEGRRVARHHPSAWSGRTRRTHPEDSWNGYGWVCLEVPKDSSTRHRSEMRAGSPGSGGGDRLVATPRVTTAVAGGEVLPHGLTASTDWYQVVDRQGVVRSSDLAAEVTDQLFSEYPRGESFASCVSVVSFVGVFGAAWTGECHSAADHARLKQVRSSRTARARAHRRQAVRSSRAIAAAPSILCRRPTLTPT